MTTSQGKFDALTKELITHVLGFQEGEENFVRSEQFVLSNLLYHHCLAVNSHAVRRSLDGLALKFTIHGQHQRAARLKDLVAKFLAAPVFKDHHETDLEWSLLSLLLHLSNSPTQVPQGEGCREPQHPLAPLEHRQPEQVDWAAYLREDEPSFEFGPEEPLSDWSGEEDDDSKRSEDKKSLSKHPSTNPITLHSPAEDPSLSSCPSLTKTPPSGLKTLEQLHRAKSWLSAKTHLQYWGPKRPYEVPVSKHPLANVAKLCREGGSGGGDRRSYQQLSEWSVMREVVWGLMCPVSSHVFITSTEGKFTVRESITLPSLTPAATRSLLEYLCEPLQQLRTLDTFLFTHYTPCLEPPTPSTVLAYALGLWHWRQAFTQHLRDLEDAIKNQESSSTLLWLEGELLPWLRAVAILHALHSKAFTLSPQASPRTVATRLLGCVCESIESAGEGGVRGMLLRLLLHTFRPYLAIMHTWLMHGALIDHTQEFIIHRDESVTVYDERFWHEAFTLSFEEDEQSQNSGAENPIKTIMKILAPLLSILTSVGKSQELLAALDVTPLTLHNRLTEQSDSSLEEVVVKYIKDTVCESQKKGDKGQPGSSESSGTTFKYSSEDDNNKENRSSKEDSSAVRLSHGHTDPLLWVAFSGMPSQHNSADGAQFAVDHIASLTEGIEDISAPISVVFLLSSAIQPLVRKRQVELSAELTRVLLSEYQLALHCQAVHSVLLMEAGDVMHEFYSHLFSKLETGEGVDSNSLTLHLQYCVSRLYPNLAQYFSVSLLLGGTEGVSSKASSCMAEDETDDLRSERVLLIEELEKSGKTASEKMQDPRSSQNASYPVFSLTKAGIPALQIHYQAPWPANLLLTEPVMKQYNRLFNFSLSLKRVTNGLERLRFRELSSWNLILCWKAEGDSSTFGSKSNTGLPDTPLQSRLHRLQLLRQWLLCFARELHDHFANTAFLPFYQAVERMFSVSPPLNTIITEHEKLLSKLETECLMGSDEKTLPLQIVLNKVFWLTQRLAQLWLGDVSRVSVDELTRLETHYAQVHRFLVNFLTTLISRSFTPHLEGLTRTLVDTVPLLTHL